MGTVKTNKDALFTTRATYIKSAKGAEAAGASVATTCAAHAAACCVALGPFFLFSIRGSEKQTELAKGMKDGAGIMARSQAEQAAVRVAADDAKHSNPDMVVKRLKEAGAKYWLDDKNKMPRLAGDALAVAKKLAGVKGTSEPETALDVAKRLFRKLYEMRGDADLRMFESTKAYLQAYKVDWQTMETALVEKSK